MPPTAIQLVGIYKPSVWHAISPNASATLNPASRRITATLTINSITGAPLTQLANAGSLYAATQAWGPNSVAPDPATAAFIEYGSANNYTFQDSSGSVVISHQTLSATVTILAPGTYTYTLPYCPATQPHGRAAGQCGVAIAFRSVAFGGPLPVNYNGLTVPSLGTTNGEPILISGIPEGYTRTAIVQPDGKVLLTINNMPELHPSDGMTTYITRTGPDGVQHSLATGVTTTTWTHAEYLTPGTHMYEVGQDIPGYSKVIPRATFSIKAVPEMYGRVNMYDGAKWVPMGTRAEHSPDGSTWARF